MKRKITSIIEDLLVGDGDWICPKCSNKNWKVWVVKDKTKCPTCGTPKPIDIGNPGQ